MENLIAKITLSRERVDVLSEKDKKMLAKVIIAQIMRVPRSLEHISKKIYPDVMKRVREKAITSLPACLIEEYRQQIMEIELPEQNQKESFFNFAFTPENFDRYCKLIQDGAWFVFVNAQREHMPFFTSDNPVLVEATGSGKIGVSQWPCQSCYDPILSTMPKHSRCNLFKQEYCGSSSETFGY